MKNCVGLFICYMSVLGLILFLSEIIGKLNVFLDRVM